MIQVKTGKAIINDTALSVDDNTVENNINTPTSIFVIKNSLHYVSCYTYITRNFFLLFGAKNIA